MRLPRIVALCLVILLVSGHTAALQVCAWASMFAERAPMMSLTTALCSTFDGSKPCQVCYAVRDLRQVDAEHGDRTLRHTPAAHAPLPAPDLLPATQLQLPEPQLLGVACWCVGGAIGASSWAAEVPTPPPCRS